MVQDEYALQQRLQKVARRIKRNQPVDKSIADIEQSIAASSQRRQSRSEQLPTIEYPSLPVADYRDEIIAAIQAHQVVVVCGETGSGKTTQLPKLCLEAGCGVRGLIGHTQPRRIAARSVANRIAEELHSKLGEQVGFKIRFSDQSSSKSYVKLMTDGILLAETQNDRLLTQYDTIIIDEAHERSLNIDFLLGYLKQLLPQRPDLKVVITSATIDPERFAKQFDDCPIIMVPGRTYPVELRYRPLHTRSVDNDEHRPSERARDKQAAQDMLQGISDAVDEVSRLDRGDILIFMSGEREIRDVSDMLQRRQLQNTDVLPLFSRLSNQEQNRIFSTGGRRKIVISTNVAETSLTVPGIRYVIDSGVARISRYSYRSKVQRLPIEKISQASANQRKGRCGRVSAGVCIRLYDEEDFENRPEFTEPEIQRTNLASVILQMHALGLGDVSDFPFIDPPDGRFIRDGYKLLQELGALDDSLHLTKVGLDMARLPLDPRIARILIAGDKHKCLSEMLVIAAMLSIQDPRERPLEFQQKADQAHAEYRDPNSDFISILNLWNSYQENAKALSNNQLRKHFRDNFLSWMRMREWSEIRLQLEQICSEIGFKIPKNAGKAIFEDLEKSYEGIHKALLTGLVTNIGFKGEDKQFLGIRSSKFSIFPGSGLFKKPPQWIMAAELVETTKVYARTVAKVEAQWIEQAARHMLKKTWFEPHWEMKQSQVMGYERSSLYGLVINPKRKVHYGQLFPKEGRELFIRRALVELDFRCDAAFYQHNLGLLTEIDELEAKARRRNIKVDDELIYQFYDDRIPHDVFSGRGFNAWRDKAEKEQAKLLFLTREYLMQQDAAEVSDALYPDRMVVKGVELKLTYGFGDDADGVTIHVPVALLNQLEPSHFDWLVPGLLKDKMTELIRSLPKALRRNFVPAPNYADACMQVLVIDGEAVEGDLLEQMCKHLLKMTGIKVTPDDMQVINIPEHLRMNFRVLDEKGKTIEQSRDLVGLQSSLGRDARQAFNQLQSGLHTKGQTTGQGNGKSEASSTQAGDTQQNDSVAQLQRENITAWDFADLPDFIEMEQGGFKIKGYPALRDCDDSVAIQLIDAEPQALAAHREGLRRLFALSIKKQVAYLEKNLPHYDQMCLTFIKVRPAPDVYADDLPWKRTDKKPNAREMLRLDLMTCILDHIFLSHNDNIRTKAEFTERLDAGKVEMMPYATDLGRLGLDVLEAYHQATKKLGGNMPFHCLEAVDDMRDQLDHLVYHGFLYRTPENWLPEFPRFMKAILVRIERLLQDSNKDTQRQRDVRKHWIQYKQKAEQYLKKGIRDPRLEEYRWMIEEYRVSLFAQELKTSRPVSEKRLNQLFAELR